ncbi:NPCBM/NEW2 domain-containing protein [Sporosarcina sp. NPDC096371]|uniref:NPCBM/NEW2 domain-containing protein n=1 Tax=Sporosarcina sp. NPDC096371 TaxID=3364530 RepID=UPI0037F5B6DA
MKSLRIFLSICMIFTLIIVDYQPVSASVKGTVIDVTKFGADPSGKTDSTKAIVAALEETKKIQGPVTLDFPKGEYHFYKENATEKMVHTSNTSSLSNPNKWISILIEEQENLTLDGNDSKFIMHGDVMAIAVIKSKNITLKNYVLDYKDADTVDLTVIGHGDGANGKPYTDLYVPENYNYQISEDKKHITWQGDINSQTGKPYWEGRDSFGAYLVIYNGHDQTVSRHQKYVDGKNISDPFNGVATIEDIGENALRFTYETARPNAQEVGNIFLLTNSAQRRTAGALFWESEKVHVENIDVHYLSGFGWLVQMSKDIEFNSVNFLPRFGSGKYTTSNADQIHAAGVGGYMNVINCNFSIAHDDPINIHGTYMRVEEVIDSKTLKMAYIHSQQGGFQQFHPGDEVMFYSRTYLELPEGLDEQTAFKVASSIGPGEDYNSKTLDWRTEIVTFEKEFDKALLEQLTEKIQVNRSGDWKTEPLYVAENVTYTPTVTIKGNKMKSIPTRGILTTTRKPVIIEDNIFENMTMANIYLSNDADYWYESGPIRNMTIRNNEFFIRPTGQTEWGNVSGIYVDPVTIRPWNWRKLDGSSSAPPKTDDLVHRNLTIDGNTFHMANDNVVTAESVQGMKITNNRIIRDNPNIGIKLSAITNHVATGDRLPLQVDVSEATLPKELFKFKNSRDILISGNTYDDGFNMNISTSEMDEEEVTNKDMGLTMNGGNNTTSAADKIQYISSDPSVAYVDEYGEVVGLKNGAEADIVAYYEWNGTMFLSNVFHVTVGNNGESTLDISVENSWLKNEGETTPVKVKGEASSIQVLDPVSGKISNAGKVENGIYTALKEGIVLIRATNETGVSSVLVVNSFDKTYGSQEKFNRESFTIERENAATWSGVDRDSVSITGEAGDLFAGKSDVNNIIAYNIPDAMKDDFRVQVTVKGLPERGEGWNNAGVMLYKDGNNYISVGKKAHMDGITTVFENNASAQENAGKTADNGLASTILEIAVQENTATMSYVAADGNWKVAHTFDASFLDKKYKIAMAAWKQGNVPITAQFGELRIAKASELDSADLMKQSAIPMFEAEENARPTVNNVKLKDIIVEESTTVSYEYEDLDNDKESKSLFEWTTTHNGFEEVMYTDTPSFAPRYTGTLKVKVYPVDARGKIGKPVESNTVQVTGENGENVQISNLYLNGLQVKEFNSDAFEYNWAIPAGYRTLHIAYSAKDTGLYTKVEDSKGNILAEATNENYLNITVPEDGIVRIVRNENTVYTLNVDSIESSDNHIKEISVNDHMLDTEIVDGTDSYYIALQDNENIVPLSIKADDGVSSISVTRSFFDIAVENQSKQKNEFKADVNLTSGLNAFYAKITAADGETTRYVKIYVYRSGYNDADIKGIEINGKPLHDFDATKTDYVINITPKDAADFNVAVSNDIEKDQRTSITINNKRIDSHQASSTLNKGKNTIIIANQAEDLWTNQYYTLHVILNSEDNANLLDLSVDNEFLTPAFDSDKTEYEISTNKNTITLNATTEIKEATIRMYSLHEEAEARGTVSATFKLYEGDNPITVEVTGNDGKTKKVYKMNVTANGVVYASDLKEEFNENGYDVLKYDVATSGAPLRLTNELGEVVTFEKGLGAHATSTIVYNIDGKGMEKFESYIGVDYVQTAQGNVPSSIRFYVYVDGVEKFDSKEMNEDDAMKFVSIDVQDAKEIKLYVDEIENNYNDHANWADAKFLKPLESHPNENVDKSKLKSLVEKEENRKNENYTDQSWNAFIDALNAAKKVLEEEILTQAMIDDALDALTTAVEQLEVKGTEPEVDVTELQDLIEMAQAISNDDGTYTESSYESLQIAIKAAKSALSTIETEEELNVALVALQSAIDGLKNNSSAAMISLIEDFEKEGEFKNASAAQSLKLHLTAVNLYEKQEAVEKVVKHMEGFKLLLIHQKENELISEKAYNALKSDADALIKKWHKFDR